MNLIGKIEQLIKREKTTPERKIKAESAKSSNEILSELFGVFNADPPKIEDITVKKSKRSKKKHKKEKKKRSRSTSSSNSDKSDYSRKRKKRKKNKSKKRKGSTPRSPSCPRTWSPVQVKPDPEQKTPEYPPTNTEDDKILLEKIKMESKANTKKCTNEDYVAPSQSIIDASLIPMPESPKDVKLDLSDLRYKLENDKLENDKLENDKLENDKLENDKLENDNLENDKLENTETDKSKSRIQIKNLKFSAVYEETVKKAEEEARKKAEKYEDGEYTDSSSSSAKDNVSNSQFPKSADPGGILKSQMVEESKVSEDEKVQSKSSKYRRSHHKSSRRRSRSRKRSRSKSRRSRSRSRSRRHHRSSSKSRRRSRSRRRSTSRSRVRPRLHSPKHRGRNRSPTGVRLADSEKKRLLEVARRNAINMLKNGAVPAGAAALPPHTRNQVMAAIQSGGKSVDELTDFCKHLSKKEALGELSSVSSNDDDMVENADTLAFHHPFLIKEKGPIVMNIRGGAPLPIKNSMALVANKEELSLQFPVSSGSQHRQKAIEWVPVSPKKDNMQVANLNAKSAPAAPPKALPSTSGESSKSSLLALPAPPSPPPYMKSFTTGTQLSTLPALPAPGPQAYPPGVNTSKADLAAIVSEKIAMIRKEQEQSELARGFGWSRESNLGQFTGSTGAQILTPRELASGTQAWTKRPSAPPLEMQFAAVDQLVRAAPVEGGMGMHLLQKMGWTPGQGLGKEGTGTLQPLLLEVKLDTRGLQAKEETGNRYGKARQQRFPRRGQAPLVAGGKHPVSLLGEYCSKQKLGPPEYNLSFECGPDHKKNFLFKVKVAGVDYQPAVASVNKKQAKADAAQLALQKLGIVTQ